MKPAQALEALTRQVTGGDSAAARKLRARLEPAVAALVRRALLFPADRSLLQAEVRSLGFTSRCELLAEDRPTVRLIARRICARLIQQIRVAWPHLPARETVNDLAGPSYTV